MLSSQQRLFNSKFGLLLRVFSPKPELVAKNVEMITGAVKTANALDVFSRIDILVSADNRFGDSDCGQTASALNNKFQGSGRVFVSEVTQGDIFCGLLNYGVSLQMRHRIDYSVILSAGVQSYMTKEIIETVLKAAENGALAIGVAIEELSESIMMGRIANTFAMWHNISLMSVGGFDLRAAKPRKDDRLAQYMRGFSDGKEVFYNLAGVEEIIPLKRLIDIYGPCIAAILPKGGENKWVAPDHSQDPEGYARHIKKLGTKFERQGTFAAMEGVDLSFFKCGVMKEYRTF